MSSQDQLFFEVILDTLDGKIQSSTVDTSHLHWVFLVGVALEDGQGLGAFPGCSATSNLHGSTQAVLYSVTLLKRLIREKHHFINFSIVHRVSFIS